MNKFVKEICERVYEETDVSSFKGKTILITGANGLIGGFLADFFSYLNDTHSFNIRIVLSSRSYYKNAERVRHLLPKMNVVYLSKDLSKADPWSDLRGHEVDYCFYCAGYAQPAKFLAQPFKTLALNSVGVYNVFNSVFKNPSARCVYLSSSEIYSSNSTVGSHREEDSLTVNLENKRNSYILGKLSGEAIVNSFRDLERSACSVRVSLCYGPGVSIEDNRVMSELARKGFGNSEFINLFDEGAAIRRYLHISDFVKMLLTITVKGQQPVYNVGGKEETTIYEMAEHVGRYYNKSIKKGESNNSISKTAPEKVWISMRKYEEEFGKVNCLPFREGLLQFLEWYEGELQDEVQ